MDSLTKKQVVLEVITHESKLFIKMKAGPGTGLKLCNITILERISFIW
jgi:hypothetical protein